MKFQYDQRKSNSNLEKHGIDFEQAQLLWNDPDMVELSARSDDEPRSLIIAKLANQFWSAIFTYRGADVRLISVRRARKSEIDIYES